MRRWRGRILALLMGATVLMCGCGRASSIQDPVLADPVLARSLLDAIYAGSMTPVQDSIDPTLLRGMSDSVTAGTASLLRDNFGEVSGLAFQASEKGPGPMKATWMVRATRGSYEMQIWHWQGKVSGFAFRPSSAQQWGLVPQIGVEYSRRGKKPMGW